MKRLGRRSVLMGGLGLAAAGALTWRGSAAICSPAGGAVALIQPLFVALADIPDAERIGRAWLEAEGAEEIARAILGRGELVSAAAIARDDVRRLRLARTIRAEFSSGDIVLADRMVVGRSEALIAGAWMA